MRRISDVNRALILAVILVMAAACLLVMSAERARAGYIRWVEHGDVPVYDPADPARAYYPCVIYDASQFSGHGESRFYKMWYGDTDSTQWQWVAYSDDGVIWEDPEPVTGIAAHGYHAKLLYYPGGYSGAGGPFFYRIWYWDANLIYTISAMRTADSADGVNWVNDRALTQDATYQLVTGVGTDWNYGTYGPVEVFYNPGAGNTGTDPFDYTYAMYYDAATGASEVTALAYSIDGDDWTRYHQAPFENAPVLDHGGPGEWDSGYSSHGTVIRESANTWHFWYSGGQTQVGDGIGYASSADGINWTKGANNPLLSKDDGVAWRATRTYTPAVLYSPTLFDGNGGDAVFKMWYTGRSSGGSYAIGYAERSSVITVGPSGRDFTTIQAAVGGAYDGDTILVDPGIYNEALRVDKELVVQSTSGAASTVIDAPDDEPYVVTLQSSNITFEGFTVTNPGYAGGSDASGIVLSESPSYGNVRIADCVVHDIGTMDRSPVTYGTVGINLGQCRDVEVDNCEIYNIGHGDTSGNWWAQGISIWGADEHNPASGIHIHGCNIHDVSSPGAMDSGIGIQGNVSGIVIENNTITDTGEYGVDTWDDSGGAYGPTVITGNAVSGATAAGIKMLYPGANPITGNALDRCAAGILITSTGNASSLRYNTFTGNTGHAIDNRSGNILDAAWCYWDSPHGPSYDGITYGETFSGGLTWRPYLAAPYGGTPPATPIRVATASPLPGGHKGHNYSMDFAASGGTAPYGWFVYHGTLPPGLSLSPTGTLSGVPTAAGDYTFYIEASDGTQADFKVFTLSVAASGPVLSFHKTPSPTGTVTRGGVISYALRLENSGGTATSGTTITDTAPAYTGYVTGTTTLNGKPVSDVAGTTPLAAGMAVHSPGRASGVIAPGETALVTFTVQVGSDLPLGGTVRNTARAEADGVAAVKASCENASSSGLPATWYFAEGSTQPGFDEYILLSNMGDADMTVTITYLTEGGTERSFEHAVPAHSRQTVYVNAEMPGEAGVAAMVTGREGLICERSMYYEHNGIRGGDDVIGTNSPSLDLFFAEGFTGTPGSPFEEWILLLNPNPEASSASIDYLFPGGETARKEYTLPGRSRTSINVDLEVGEGREVSAHIRSELPVVAERAMYFIYNNVWPGGHNGMASTGARADWYLAEGYTGYEGSLFDEWILVANQNEQPAAVTITYMFPDGSTSAVEHTAAPRSRLTASADAEVGEGQMVSAHVHSDVPVVVERAMYFDYRLQWQGGHNCLGATAPASELYFAEGYTGNPGSQFETWVLVQNTAAEAKAARVDYILMSGEVVSREIELPAHSRTTVFANQVLGRESLEFSIRVTSVDGSPTLLAERAMYFSYSGPMGTSQGGHDVVGY